MCGIFGVLDVKNSSDQATWVQELHACSSTLAHRGPDGEGTWFDHGAGIALFHRRLSIIDLRSMAGQPMRSNDGRFIIIFNGEIYNYRSIRQDLIREGIAFKTESDTEVLLEAIALYGVDRTCQLINGMFAFALWDTKQNVLTLARDPFGQKPLYYGWQNGILFFGSELKPFMHHPRFKAERSRESLNLYLRHGYVPAPRSIFQGIFKLMPGSLVEFDRLSCKYQEYPSPKKYFCAQEVAQNGIDNRTQLDLSEAADYLEDLLLDAVGKTLIADVPVGCFLSGGVDSSLIAALAQQAAGRPIKTFSIGFDDPSFDESKYARSVAQHLKTDHQENIFHEDDVLDLIPKLSSIYDEPFADSSQLPTILVSELARSQVKVALSGDAGDELFGGYNRYIWSNYISYFTDNSPNWFCRTTGGVMRSLPPHIWDMLGKAVPLQTPLLLGDKLHKLSRIVDQPNAAKAYLAATSLWQNPQNVVNCPDPNSSILDSFHSLNSASNLESMMLADTQNYLPNDILTKVDRASMALGLETRVPFLDPRIMEFAWSLPTHMKLNQGKGKQILRLILNRYVPHNLVDRPKMGFGLPLADWLRGPLYSWANETLSKSSIEDAGMFNVSDIHSIWEQHISGKRNFQHQIWAVLIAQSWHKYWQN